MNHKTIAGIDEAGRGALAGPVVSALVILDENLQRDQFKDSKRISKQKRENLYSLLRKSNSIITFSIVNNREIDRINILEATFTSMINCIKQLDQIPHKIIIDGNRLPKMKNVPMESCIKGDTTVSEISAASIVAKVIRDNLMSKYNKLFPKYNFNKHKGYGTKSHYKEIETFGVTKIHRKTFKIQKFEQLTIL